MVHGNAATGSQCEIRSGEPVNMDENAKTDREFKRMCLLLAGVMIVLLVVAVAVRLTHRVQAVAPAPPADAPDMGYHPDPDATDKFLDSLEKPNIQDAGPTLFEEAPQPDRKGTFLYRPLREAHKAAYGTEWTCGRQGIGDCVSWAWAHAINTATAVEWKLGTINEWRAVSTESIYGAARVNARGFPIDGKQPYGGFQDGSYGAAAAKAVTTYGVLFRRKYDHYDLTTYSADRAKEWGAYGLGGKDDNGRAEEEARKFLVKNVAYVRTFEGASKAIDSGYPVAVCSQQGFRPNSGKVRDKDGFGPPDGVWAHGMCFVATRYDRPGLLCVNQWGEDWISGPVWPADQPKGTFWVDAAVVNGMLAGTYNGRPNYDSFCVAALAGFEKRPLDNGAWVQLRAKPDRSFVLVP